jgi:hypothetical protein
VHDRERPQADHGENRETMPSLFVNLGCDFFERILHRHNLGLAQTYEFLR